MEQVMTPEALLGPLNEVERKNAPSLFVAGDVNSGAGLACRWWARVTLRQARSGRAHSPEPSSNTASRSWWTCRGRRYHAHETALAEGGRTIAVLGTAIDDAFPAKNRALQERLGREQLVVSQFPRGVPAQRGNFPMRNRTMALLSDATVIVEAGEKSGTLHQGWEALRLGRLLFLMERVATNPALSWPKEMIRYGAQVLSRANLELVLAEMPEVFRGEPASL